MYVLVTYKDGENQMKKDGKMKKIKWKKKALEWSQLLYSFILEAQAQLIM